MDAAAAQRHGGGGICALSDELIARIGSLLSGTSRNSLRLACRATAAAHAGRSRYERTFQNPLDEPLMTHRVRAAMKLMPHLRHIKLHTLSVADANAGGMLVRALAAHLPSTDATAGAGAAGHLIMIISFWQIAAFVQALRDVPLGWQRGRKVVVFIVPTRDMDAAALPPSAAHAFVDAVNERQWTIKMGVDQHQLGAPAARALLCSGRVTNLLVMASHLFGAVPFMREALAAVPIISYTLSHVQHVAQPAAYFEDLAPHVTSLRTSFALVSTDNESTDNRECSATRARAFLARSVLASPRLREVELDLKTPAHCDTRGIAHAMGGAIEAAGRGRRLDLTLNIDSRSPPGAVLVTRMFATLPGIKRLRVSGHDAQAIVCMHHAACAARPGTQVLHSDDQPNLASVRTMLLTRQGMQKMQSVIGDSAWLPFTLEHRVDGI